MARIFLSYKREERDRVRAIVAALEAKGHTVWWDPHLDPRDTAYPLQIKREIDAADACIVAWSKLSVASDFVVSEAEMARAQKKLVCVRLDHDCMPPPPFNTMQLIDLSDWHGDAGNPEWKRVLGAVSGEGGNPAMNYPSQESADSRALNELIASIEERLNPEHEQPYLGLESDCYVSLRGHRRLFRITGGGLHDALTVLPDIGGRGLHRVRIAWKRSWPRLAIAALVLTFLGFAWWQWYAFHLNIFYFLFPAVVLLPAFLWQLQKAESFYTLHLSRQQKAVFARDAYIPNANDMVRVLGAEQSDLDWTDQQAAIRKTLQEQLDDVCYFMTPWRAAQLDRDIRRAREDIPLQNKERALRLQQRREGRVVNPDQLWFASWVIPISSIRASRIRTITKSFDSNPFRDIIWALAGLSLWWGLVWTIYIVFGPATFDLLDGFVSASEILFLGLSAWISLRAIWTVGRSCFRMLVFVWNGLTGMRVRRYHVYVVEVETKPTQWTKLFTLLEDAVHPKVALERIRAQAREDKILGIAHSQAVTMKNDLDQLITTYRHQPRR